MFQFVYMFPFVVVQARHLKCKKILDKISVQSYIPQTFTRNWEFYRFYISNGWNILLLFIIISSLGVHSEGQFFKLLFVNPPSVYLKPENPKYFHTKS